MAAVSAINLADYIVRYSTDTGQSISNLQLQKIMYFIQSVYCRATNGELLFDDEFEAWPYGPVLPNVYQRYSSYGGRVIEEAGSVRLNLDEKQRAFIDGGVLYLREKSPWDLVRTTHAPGSPWSVVYDNGLGYRKPIPNELLIKASLSKGDGNA